MPNGPLSPFLPVAQNQSSGIFTKCPFRGLAQLGIMSSVVLHIPFLASGSITRSLGGRPLAPAVCQACGAPRCEGLAPGLMEDRHRQGLPEKVSHPRGDYHLDGKSKANLKN